VLKTGIAPLLLLPTAAWSANDVIVLTNGDQLKGEIKELTKKVVVMSTDYSDEDFRIKWEKVAKIESDRTFLVEKFSGDRLEGSIKTEQKDAVVGGEKVPLNDVAYVKPFEQTFWSRLDAGFDIGYSMTKANSVKQLSGALNAAYTGERSLVSLSGNIFLNEQANAPRTRRWELSPQYRHLLGRVWYADVMADFYSSQEQQLSLRYTQAAGIGRYFLRSPVQHLAVGVGLAFTSEKYVDPTIPRQNSAEFYTGVEYVTERLKFADLVTSYIIYPSLTIQGRYRMNFKADLDFNLPGDWYFTVGYYNNFDSMPPNSLPRNDYGWRNSIGYKF
jgi:hypothetical protein